MNPMNVQLVFIQVLIALLLFFLANWLGKYSVTSGYHILSLFEQVDEAPAFNLVFRVATPLVFLAIAAAALYELMLDSWVQHFYMVVVYYFLIRWIYAIAVSRGRLLSWTRQITTGLITVAFAYALYHRILANRGTLLPDAASFNSNLWILIIVYMYTVINQIPFTHAGAYRRRAAYIEHRFHTLCAAYSTIVTATAKTPEEEALVYAVMIYETFNRPYLYRAVETYLLQPFGWAKSVGPMQVQTSQRLDDEASVRLGSAKLLELFRVARPASEQQVAPWDLREGDKRRYAREAAVRAASRAYNVRGDYSDEIQVIFDDLVKQFYPAAELEPPARPN
jgi:hypothetical protein